ncbi:MAG: hypothetical protein AAF533_20310 [Acidobacteriota bacterium]
MEIGGATGPRLALSPEQSEQLQTRRRLEAAEAWEARLLEDLLRPALEKSLPGPAGQAALTAFAEAMASAGATGLGRTLAESLTKEMSDRPSSSEREVR